MKKELLVMASATFCLSAGAAVPQLHYPETRKDNVVDEYFGVKVADPYRWLENDTSKETAAWVEAQRKVTKRLFEQSAVS